MMTHKGTNCIETERLILRPFTMDDAEAAFMHWTHDDRVTHFLRWPTHESVDVTRRIVRMWVDGYADPAFYQWAIVLKEIGEPIGTISVVDRNEDLDILHIGYCIGSGFWGRGITTEAFRAIIPYLFREVGANRIESQHDPRNPGSGRVMQKCGLRYEGTLRQADFNNTGIVDACLYCLLREEWEHDT